MNEEYLINEANQNESKMSSKINTKDNRHVVVATYYTESVFEIPDGLDLEDVTIVKYWGVRYNELVIVYVNGEEKRFSPKLDACDDDLKHPKELEIEPVEDVGYEYEEEDEEEDDENRCDCCANLWNEDAPSDEICHCGHQNHLLRDCRYVDCAKLEKEIEEDEEDDDEECCDGKHCSSTKNLKKGLTLNWNRFGKNEELLIENNFCEECYELDTKNDCSMCSRCLPYTELKYRCGGIFGGVDSNIRNRFYCDSCIKSVENITSYGMEGN